MGQWYNIQVKFTGEKPTKKQILDVSDELEDADYDFPVNHDKNVLYLNGSGQHPFEQKGRYRSPMISINEVLKILNKHFPCSLAVENGFDFNLPPFKDEDFMTYPTEKDWEDYE